jgi:hypothetical protein
MGIDKQEEGWREIFEDILVRKGKKGKGRQSSRKRGRKKVGRRKSRWEREGHIEGPNRRRGSVANS